MKLINEVWWIAVDPDDVPIWPLLDLQRRNVKELLNRDQPQWKRDGWRIAKIKVAETKRTKR